AASPSTGGRPRNECGVTRSGFTLIEMSMVVAIIAVVAAASVSMGSSMIESARRVSTTNKLNTIEAALMAYRLGYNRLPCPSDPALTDVAANSTTFGYESGTAGTCGGGSTVTYTMPSPGTGTVVEGAVPVKTLGLPDEFQVDGWGRKFSYAVWTPLTAVATGTGSPAAFLNYGISPSCGAIKVENAGHGNRSTAAAYALISYGPDGHGGYLTNGTRFNAGVSNIDEDTNAHYSSAGADTGYAATYIEKEYGTYAGDNDAAHPFGDYVRFKERWQMQDAYDAYSPYGSPCSIGFRLDGFNQIDYGIGYAVATGDFNNDGYPDMVVSSPRYSIAAGVSFSGSVFVVFGGPGNLIQNLSPLVLNTCNGS